MELRIGTKDSFLFRLFFIVKVNATQLTGKSQALASEYKNDMKRTNEQTRKKMHESLSFFSFSQADLFNHKSPESMQSPHFCPFSTQYADADTVGVHSLKICIEKSDN